MYFASPALWTMMLGLAAYRRSFSQLGGILLGCSNLVTDIAFGAVHVWFECAAVVRIQDVLAELSHRICFCHPTFFGSTITF